MRKCAIALVLAASVTAPGFSQEFPLYEETGTIAITIGDEQMLHYTTWNTVPGEPGREVHTASWIVLEPRLLGGVNISPDNVFVAITSRETIAPEAWQTTLKVEFSLDPETLEMRTKPAPTISFHPAGSDTFYALTDGVLEIESLTQIDPDSFSIIGRASGMMTGQSGWEVVHNPDDPIEFSAEFDLKRVVNRDAN